MIDWPNKKINT